MQDPGRISVLMNQTCFTSRLMQGLLDGTLVAVYAAADRRDVTPLIAADQCQKRRVSGLKRQAGKHFYGCSCRGHVAAPDQGPALWTDRAIGAFRSRILRRQGDLPDRHARLVFP